MVIMCFIKKGQTMKLTFTINRLIFKTIRKQKFVMYTRFYIFV